MTKDELKPIDTSKYKITETGQVLKRTKDGMKDKISMALKDPILQMKLSRLEKENAELKEQFTKAKEIIKKFLEFVNNEIEFDPEHPQEHTDLWNKLCEKAEEFIREIEE